MKRRKIIAGVLGAWLSFSGPGRVFAAPSPVQPVTEEDMKQLQEDVRRFEEASKDFRGTVRHIVQREYTEKRKAVMAKYQAGLDREEKEEKNRRQAAIALFEAFLSKYGNDERWTPDAMFRLAELYFERSSEEYLAATAQAGASGANITPDYNKTVEIYRQLITKFPQYRLIDGAYYLMAYCLGEMAREREALQIMRSLVCANQYKPTDPPGEPEPSKGRLLPGSKIEDKYAQCEPVKKESRFLPEAWTRIGETHFDNNELELAIAAYGRVLKFPESPYYDKALYKQAWSYYRADNYPEAIKRFDELVVFSDKKKAESGQEGSDLRTEAVQYLGISFAEKDWNGDGADDAESGLDRAERFYRGRESEPHVREIFAKLGDIYFDETEYFRAIAVYKRTLAKWPYDPGNPKLQDRVVMAFERQRDFENALKEREVLARNYTKGTDWYKKNRDNREAIDQAAELAELALVSAAVNHHKAAQDLKKLAAASKKPSGDILERISKEYAQAALAYEKYLDQYPASKNTYEYSYSYAETLYYSGRFLDAAKAYEKVRDSNLDNKYAEDAAFNAVKSYEKYLETQAVAGKYKEPPLPEVGKVATPVKPLDIPEPVQALQRAYEAFTSRVPSSGRVPTMTYKVAEIDYRYLHWDTARPRFEQIVSKYCKEDIGANAGNALIVSYTIENDLEKLGEWAEKLKNLQCGGTAIAAKNAGELNKLSLGVKFKKADKLFEEGKFEEAAQLYTQIVDRDPKSEDADKALNNAAVAYEKVNRFGAAQKLYERIVTDYPNSKFLDDALFRTAVAYQKAFDFDKAVVSYQRLAEDPKFKDSKNRTNSLYNAAVILENDQNYAKSAELFKRYAALSSTGAVKREEAAEAFFRAATIYQKMKDPDKTIATLKEYIRTYGGDPKGAGRVLEANFRMAEAYEMKKDRRAADDQYRKVVAMGASVTPGSEQAEFAAHAAFILAEEKLQDYLKLKIVGGKQFKASYDKMASAVKQMTEEYNRVIGFRRATWTLGAFFRIGFLYEHLSKSMAGLLQEPCPAEVKRKIGEEGCNIYLSQLSEQIEKELAPVDEEVVKRYGATLEQAGKLGVSNEWTKLARQRANQYNPEKFPAVKDERIDMQMDVGAYVPPGSAPPEVKPAADFIARGRYEDAIRQAKLALGRDDRSVPAMIILAKAYYAMKKYELAGSIVEIAKSIDANSGDAYHLLGYLALAREDRIGATAAFKKATELNGNLGTAWNNLAAQYLQAKNYDGALDAAQRATQLLPQFAKAWLNLGSAYRGKMQYADAERAYRKAIEIDPNYANAYFNLGILYLDAKEMPQMDLIGKLNTAINYLNRYKSIASFALAKDDPADGYIADARTQITKEQQRIQRQQQKNRAQPKPAAPAAGGGKVGDK